MQNDNKELICDSIFFTFGNENRAFDFPWPGMYWRLNHVAFSFILNYENRIHISTDTKAFRAVSEKTSGLTRVEYRNKYNKAAMK